MIRKMINGIIGIKSINENIYEQKGIYYLKDEWSDDFCNRGFSFYSEGSFIERNLDFTEEAFVKKLHDIECPLTLASRLLRVRRKVLLKRDKYKLDYTNSLSEFKKRLAQTIT